MDADIRSEAADLEDTKASLEVDAGDIHTRIRLLELTLAQSVSLTRMLTDGLIEIKERLSELENKFEHARLYGFSISAEDE